MIYEPAEDSFLLKGYIKDYAKGKKLVLDVGTGSGIQALEASKYAERVIAIDINEESIKCCKAKIKEDNIEFRQSDLFSDVDEKFDLIIFNPPYLPLDKSEPEDSRLATTGGKKGFEVIERFLNKVTKHLDDNGIILLLFSTLTKVEKVNEIIEKNNLKYKKLGSQSLFFEELIVYEITQ